MLLSPILPLMLLSPYAVVAFTASNAVVAFTASNAVVAFTASNAVVVATTASNVAVAVDVTVFFCSWSFFVTSLVYWFNPSDDVGSILDTDHDVSHAVATIATVLLKLT